MKEEELKKEHFKIVDGDKRSSLTIQEVYEKMQNQFFEGFKAGQLSKKLGEEI